MNLPAKYRKTLSRFRRASHKQTKYPLNNVFVNSVFKTIMSV